MKNKSLIIIVGILLVVIVVLLATITINLVLKSQSAEIPPTLDLEVVMAETIAAFTPTNTPSNTPANTPTASITPTPKPTKTNTATATPLPDLPTRTPVPTRAKSLTGFDPASELGEPTWVDPFHDDGGWTLFDNNCIKTEIKDGLYIMTAKNANSALCWETTWARIQNYYLRVRVNNPKNCDGRDRFGILFRAPNTNNGYFFGVTCEREYWLGSWDGEAREMTMLIDYTESQYLTLSPGKFTDLGVHVTGKQIGLYINGNLIDSIYDETYLDPGLIGFFIGSANTENLSVEFEELVYWEIE